mmetsp:Transcript_22081/g.37709  ORF Transcript_22081/g.37709 Transcript_22081/m.37709 type:complete len:205 (-) Transcript_22081:198-812(-)
MAKEVRLILFSWWRQSRLHLRSPVGLVPSNELSSVGSLVAIAMSRWEILKLVAFMNHALHLTTNIDGSIIPPSNVQGSFSNVITKNEVSISRLIIHDNGEHTTKLIGKIGSRNSIHLRPQWEHNLTVTSRFGCVWGRQSSVDFFIVVNLSVGCHDDIAVGRHERLLARLGIHNGKTLVCDTVVERSLAILLDDEVAGPIGATVT